MGILLQIKHKQKARDYYHQHNVPTIYQQVSRISFLNIVLIF